MFDISTMFSEQIATLRPHAARVGEECRSWGDAVLGRLDALVVAAQQTPFEEQRIYLEGSVSAFIPTPLGKGPGTDPIVVPPGEEWLLETVHVTSTASDLQFNIVGASLNPSVPADGMGLGSTRRRVFGAKSTGMTASFGGNGVIVQGNTPLWVVAGGSMDYMTQWKRKRLHVAKSTTAGGIMNPNPQANTIEESETYRHTGTWAPNR